MFDLPEALPELYRAYVSLVLERTYWSRENFLTQFFLLLWILFSDLQAKRISAKDALSHPYLDEGRLRYHTCMCTCCFSVSSGRIYTSDFEPRADPKFDGSYEKNLTSVWQVKGSQSCTQWGSWLDFPSAFGFLTSALDNVHVCFCWITESQDFSSPVIHEKEDSPFSVTKYIHIFMKPFDPPLPSVAVLAASKRYNINIFTEVWRFWFVYNKLNNDLDLILILEGAPEVTEKIWIQQGL